MEARWRARVLVDLRIGFEGGAECTLPTSSPALVTSIEEALRSGAPLVLPSWMRAAMRSAPGSREHVRSHE